MNDQGKWKTGPAAHYPGALCKFLAEAIWKTWSESSAPEGFNAVSSDSTGGKVETHKTAVEQPCKVTIESGCVGPPLTASHAGRSEEFCDGLGLCSPGRWRPQLRQQQKSSEQLAMCRKLRGLLDEFCLKNIRDLGRATIEVASGKHESSLFSEEALDRLRHDWFKMLPDPRQAAVLEPDQPFYLHALAQSLRLVGDPDVVFG